VRREREIRSALAGLKHREYPRRRWRKCGRGYPPSSFFRTSWTTCGLA
jgi:hypothetical protein